MNVLITGAAGGLGRAFAIECARRGYRLFLTDISADGLQSIQAGLKRQFAVMAETAVCDITKDDDVQRLMNRARALDFQFDLLLNVAGIDYEGGFSARSFDQISGILNVNIEATLRVTHHVLAQRSLQRPLYIVFVSSLAAMNPIPLKATYAASKRFLLDFSFALGQELKAQKVHVLSLCPGGLSTTPEAVSGIAAQGFWGSVTTNKLERVVKKTLDRALRGKKLYVPGTVNHVLSVCSKLVPRGLVVKLLFSRWNVAQQQWLQLETKPNN